MKQAGDRECLINGVVGETGVGKSYQLHIEIAHYLKNTPTKRGRKVLIFDTNGEYLEYPAIPNCNSEAAFIKSLSNWTKVECRRINAQRWTPDQKKQGLFWCHQHFKNGLLVVDDIDKIVAHSQNQEIISTLMGNRHDALDVVLCHQSLEMPTTNFYRNVTTLRLHNQKSNDNVLRSKAKGSYPILKIASLIIQRQYRANNNRFFLQLHLRNEKIYGIPPGDAGKKEFEIAVRTYLNINNSEVSQEINEMVSLNMINYADRNKPASREKAIARLIKEYERYIQ